MIPKFSPKPHDVPRDLDIVGSLNSLKRPPTQTDDGWVIVGDDTEFAPPFENDWTHADEDKPVSFFLDPHGVVRIRGKATGGEAGTTVFTLPVGFRPEFTQNFVSDGGSDGIIGRIQVEPTGEVQILSAGTIPGESLDAGSNGFWKTVGGVLTRVTTVAWSELTGIPSTLDANARVGIRKNSTGSTFLRRRVNLIEGSNITITVADDSTNEEVDITITGSAAGSVATDAIWDAKGDLAAATGADTAAKLTVGANDKILKANSAQSTGLEWADIDGGSA